MTKALPNTNLITIIFGVIVLMTRFFEMPTLDWKLEQHVFLRYHVLLELFSIVGSYVIALQCWFSFPYNLSLKKLLLGALFFTVGSLDIMHTLVFKGMPPLFYDSSIAKSVWLWVAARLTEAVFLTLVVSIKDRRTEKRGERLCWYGLS